jgi:hypothetical protein
LWVEIHVQQQAINECKLVAEAFNGDVNEENLR